MSKNKSEQWSGEARAIMDFCKATHACEGPCGSRHVRWNLKVLFRLMAAYRYLSELAAREPGTVAMEPYMTFGNTLREASETRGMGRGVIGPCVRARLKAIYKANPMCSPALCLWFAAKPVSGLMSIASDRDFYLVLQTVGDLKHERLEDLAPEFDKAFESGFHKNRVVASDRPYVEEIISDYVDDITQLTKYLFIVRGVACYFGSNSSIRPRLFVKSDAAWLLGLVEKALASEKSLKDETLPMFRSSHFVLDYDRNRGELAWQLPSVIACGVSYAEFERFGGRRVPDIHPDGADVIFHYEMELYEVENRLVLLHDSVDLSTRESVFRFREAVVELTASCADQMDDRCFFPVACAEPGEDGQLSLGAFPSGCLGGRMHRAAVACMLGALYRYPLFDGDSCTAVASVLLAYRWFSECFESDMTEYMKSDSGLGAPDGWSYRSEQDAGRIGFLRNAAGPSFGIFVYPNDLFENFARRALFGNTAGVAAIFDALLTRVANSMTFGPDVTTSAFSDIFRRLPDDVPDAFYMHAIRRVRELPSSDLGHAFLTGVSAKEGQATFPSAVAGVLRGWAQYE